MKVTSKTLLSIEIGQRDQARIDAVLGKGETLEIFVQKAVKNFLGKGVVHRSKKTA